MSRGIVDRGLSFGRGLLSFPGLVVAVARRREAPQKQIAEDFGISHATLSNWLRQADVEDGDKAGVTREQSEELRELRRRNRLLEQENEVLRRASAYLS